MRQFGTTRVVGLLGQGLSGLVYMGDLRSDYKEHKPNYGSNDAVGRKGSDQRVQLRVWISRASRVRGLAEEIVQPRHIAWWFTHFETTAGQV